VSEALCQQTTWDGFFSALQAADVPEDFLSEAQRAQGTHDRDPLEGWQR
jgi:antitoxin VapB